MTEQEDEFEDTEFDIDDIEVGEEYDDDLDEDNEEKEDD